MESIYTHTKAGGQYKIIDFCKIQQNNEWIDAYIYEKYPKVNGIHSDKYVRSISEFKHKFVKLEKELNKTDGYSILELVRNFQLSEILGKYKLWK